MILDRDRIIDVLFSFKSGRFSPLTNVVSVIGTCLTSHSRIAGAAQTTQHGIAKSAFPQNDEKEHKTANPNSSLAFSPTHVFRHTHSALLNNQGTSIMIGLSRSLTFHLVQYSYALAPVGEQSNKIGLVIASSTTTRWICSGWFLL
jgi:hypothetical protein